MQVSLLRTKSILTGLRTASDGCLTCSLQVDIDEGSIGQHPVIHKADLEFLGYPNFSGYIYPGGGSFPQSDSSRSKQAVLLPYIVRERMEALFRQPLVSGRRSAER